MRSPELSETPGSYRGLGGIRARRQRHQGAETDRFGVGGGDSFTVGAGFHGCAVAASESCQTCFGLISDRFAKDTRSRALLYISLV